MDGVQPEAGGRVPQDPRADAAQQKGRTADQKEYSSIPSNQVEFRRPQQRFVIVIALFDIGIGVFDCGFRRALTVP